ncbi:MAG: hypothetical protein V1839_00680 [archaeon]
MALSQKTVGYVQIAIGIIAILFWIVNFVMTGIIMKSWWISTTNSTELLIGIFALVTGFHTLKK